MWSALRTLVSSAAAGGCPVIHGGKSDASAVPPAGAVADRCGSSGGGCPVVHGGISGVGSNGSSSSSSKDGSSGCPVVHGGEAINPLNMMPAPNQQAAPGQASSLDTARVESTIPNREGSHWVYPSPQMFYNALVRKGKGDGVQEDTMDAVVAIHNNMNENTWKQVLEWEARHSECSAPRKLVRFVGRPDELSHKAAAHYYLGLRPRPFDRHDWTVDRCGKEVRYIIDYYDVASKRSADRLPQLHDVNAVQSIEVDVRPALDSSGALLDRMRVLASGLSVPPTAQESAALQGTGDGAGGEAAVGAGEAAARRAAVDAVQAMGGAGEAAARRAAVDAVRQTCADKMAMLSACKSERECSLAHIGLTMCIAQQVCAAEADAFTAMRASADDPNGAAEAARKYGAVEACVARWGQEAQADAAA